MSPPVDPNGQLPRPARPLALELLSACNVIDTGVKPWRSMCEKCLGRRRVRVLAQVWERAKWLWHWAWGRSMALSINRPWRPPERNVRPNPAYGCDAPCTMTNRSDWRSQDHEVSTCHEHDGAMGRWYATSSSRAGILRNGRGGGRIDACSRHGRQRCGMLAEGEGRYTDLGSLRRCGDPRLQRFPDRQLGVTFPS